MDQHILRLAAEGNKEKLKDMVMNGYSSINIFDIKGRPCSYIAKKEGHRNVCDWIETVNETFVSLKVLAHYLMRSKQPIVKHFSSEAKSCMIHRIS